MQTHWITAPNLLIRENDVIVFATQSTESCPPSGVSRRTRTLRGRFSGRTTDQQKAINSENSTASKRSASGLPQKPCRHQNVISQWFPGRKKMAFHKWLVSSCYYSWLVLACHYLVFLRLIPKVSLRDPDELVPNKGSSIHTSAQWLTQTLFSSTIWRPNSNNFQQICNIQG